MQERKGKRKYKGKKRQARLDVVKIVKYALEALDRAGGVEYMTRLANDKPLAFLALLGRMVPRAMELRIDNRISIDALVLQQARVAAEMAYEVPREMAHTVAEIPIERDQDEQGKQAQAEAVKAIERSGGLVIDVEASQDHQEGDRASGGILSPSETIQEPNSE